MSISTHRLRTLRLILLSWSILALGSARGADQGDAVTWAIYDLAPSYFVSGTPTPNTLGEGIGDKLLAMLIAAMPEYDHKVALMTIPRVLAEMQAGKPLCVVNVQRSPERMRLAYSTPLLTTPAPQLVLSARLLALHPDWENGVTLASLVRDASLHGQYLAGRSFGEKLDTILHADTNLGMKPNSGATAANALRMIEAGRADYTLEYPVMLGLGIREQQTFASLRTIPLTDANPFVDGYVLCTRNAWGQKTMRRIDKVLQQSAATPEYQNALARWLPRQELQAHAREYQRFYAKRASTLYCKDECP